MQNILYVLAIICAIWVIYDIWAKQRFSIGEKLIWTILALFFSILTAIIYYFVKKR